MELTSLQNSPGTYDSRWFIWTIVFLVVTGISLVSYITLSDTTSTDVPSFNKINRRPPPVAANKNIKK